MTVGVDDRAIRLIGSCGVEEVEALVGYLDRNPDLHIDLSAATMIHTALWQAIIVFRPRIADTPILSSISDKVKASVKASIAESASGPSRQLAKASPGK